MSTRALNAISPVDGRYADKTKALSPYFSEYALIKYRVRVEVEYFIALCEFGLPQLATFPPSGFPQLRSLYTDFTTEQALEVKSIEQVTNHDVKAVEYLIKQFFDQQGWEAYKEFIHF
ncbi:MAG TPA: adenylosuccinate lyase, partial [Flavobacteriaceae bacterium]|nr:adenylosuccinate lyase [Flavobacteriaceae bacterium]